MQISKKKSYVIMYSILVCTLLVSIFSYNKRIIVTIDGEEHVIYSSVLTVEGFVEEIEEQKELEDYIYDYSNSSDTLLHNTEIDIITNKNIILDFNGEIIEFKTYSVNYEKLYEEIFELLEIEDTDKITYMLTSEDVDLTDGLNLTLVKIEEKEIVEQHAGAIKEVVVENANLTKGVTRVVDEGQAAVYDITYSTIYYNDIEMSKVEENRALVTEGRDRTVEVGTRETVFNAGDGSVWDQLAQCESGGNWNINTGNGYYGGLQFSAATWRTASQAVGLSIDYASNASREQQIMAAEWLIANSSWGQQWPACSRKIGLS